MSRIVVAIAEHRLRYGRSEILLEEHSAARGVDGIDRIPLRRHVDDGPVPLHPANRLVCQHQRLRIDLVVDSNGMQQAEGRTA